MAVSACVEMLHIINEAWKGNVDSYLAGVIRGVARFISVYEGEYSRERLVQQLARTHPKTITQLAQKDTGSSANRHMRQILRIYNGASREMSLPLKKLKVSFYLLNNSRRGIRLRRLFLT